MKTIFTFLVLVTFVLRLTAQQAGPTPATQQPATNKEELLRRALERAYANVDSNQPARTGTAPTRAAVTVAAGATNAAGALTPVPTRRINTPAATTNVTAPAAAADPTTAPATNVTAPTVATKPSTNAPVASTAAPGAATTNIVAGAPTPARPATNAVAGAVTPLPGPVAPVATATSTNATATRTNLADAAGDKGAEKMSKKPEDDIIPAGEIRFQDTDISQVLEIYQELTGRTVLRPASLPQAKITIRTQTALTRKEAIQALDSILALNQITMVPQGEKFVKALQTAQAPQAGMIFYNADPEDLPEAGQYVSYIAKLEYADPTDIIQAIQPFASPIPSSIVGIKATQTLILRDYAENVKRMVEVLRKIDVYVPAEYKPVVIPIKYALASDIAQVLSTLTAGGGGVTSVGQRPQLQRFGLGGGGAGGGIGGTGTGVPGQPGYGQPSYGQPGTTGLGGPGGIGGAGAGQRSTFSQRLQQIVSRASSQGAGEIIVLGNVKIIADERINALLVFANDEDIKTIREIIDKLDVVLPQVLIEAIVLEVNLDSGLSYGVTALQHTKTAGKFTGAGASFPPSGPPLLSPEGLITLGTNLNLPSGFSYFGRFAGNLDLAVQALASDNRATVIQRPRIQTSHAVPCSIFIGETHPYVTGTYGGAYGGGYGSQISQLRVGVELDILPLINPDGLVVMDIQQRVDSVGGFATIANIGDVPITKENTANAKVSVRDGETIVLGGIIKNEKTKTKAGVPFLKDIPGLGILFRNTKDTGVRRELLVMIRPTVLPNPEDAAIAAVHEKSKMPGITAAEREWSKEETKQQKKAAKDLYKREGLE